MSEPINNFPKGFFWGASTSSHQVEGNTHNQWTIWELANATEHAKQAESKYSWLPNWEDIKQAAQTPENYISGAGVDHFSRYKEDFQIVKQLNLNSFRFGIEWSRIEPEEGSWDQSAIDHYKKYIAELRDLGIEPFLNLWHWTNPVWFEEKGAFTKKRNLKYFDRFVQKVAEELLDGVNYVLTLNEANNYAIFGYFLNTWPPQKKNDIFNTLKVYYNLTLVHKSAYKILKKHKPSLQIGVAHNTGASIAKSKNNPSHRLQAHLNVYGWESWFFNRINKYQDFVGINWYHTNYWKLFAPANPKTPVNDMGWYMEPSRLYDIIMRHSKKFKKPVIVTETGVADAKDQYRQWWIEESILAVNRALAEGADVRGYLYWSLLDNFEWAEGWWPKFGLVEVDRENNMKRTIRPSAKWFANRIKEIS